MQHVYLITAEPASLAQAARFLQQTGAKRVRSYAYVLPWNGTVADLRRELLEASPKLSSAVIAELTGGEFSA